MVKFGNKFIFIVKFSQRISTVTIHHYHEPLGHRRNKPKKYLFLVAQI